ncbi:proprotein convertase P-domain-containing protein [Ruegeria pomeroyi]|nr:proprotein convertase P-domain-containing protein [Ruegeria pomeroyi]
MPTATYDSSFTRNIGSGDRYFSFNVLGDLPYSEVENVSLNFFINYNNGAAVDLGDVDIWLISPEGRRVRVYDNFDGIGKDTDDGNDSDRSDDYDISFWGTDSVSNISVFMDGQQVQGNWQLQVRNNTGVTLQMKYLNVDIDYNFADPTVRDIRVIGDLNVGEEIEIEAELANIGNKGIGSFGIEYYVNGSLIGGDTLSLGLPGGWTDTETIKYTLTEEGANSIEVRIVDVDGDSRTSNNSRTESYRVGPDLPDLFVSDISAFGYAIAGQSVVIETEVTNQSDSYQAPFSISYYVNGSKIGEDTYSGGLLPGQTDPETISYTVSTTGQQEIEVRINRGDSLGRTELFGVSRADEPARTVTTSLAEIELGAFMARVVYGDDLLPDVYNGDNSDNGRDDNYRGYLSQRGWTVLTEGNLGQNYVSDNDARFQSGGLFEGRNSLLWAAQGLLAEGTMADGSRTVALTFRGTDDSDWPLALSGQAWGGNGLFDQYVAHDALIEAALAYVNDPGNGIDRLVVSGHSLGGSMADIFATVDAHRVSADVDLAVISLASAGIDPDVYTDSLPFKGFDLQYDPAIPELTGNPLAPMQLNAPGYYIGLSHREDRVTFAGESWVSPEPSLTTVLTLLTNVNFEDGLTQIDLPNVENTEFSTGFGAEHDPGLYWASIWALANDPLSEFRGTHRIQIGRTDYDSLPEYEKETISLFEKSANTAIDDRLSKALTGNGNRDFIMGLAGRDELVGLGGNDLLSGGIGNDTLNGGTGNDRLDGGLGEDEAVFDSSSSDLLVYREDEAFVLFTSEGRDTVTGVERFRFNDIALDEADLNERDGIGRTLTGTPEADDLKGTELNDSVSGLASNDRLLGYEGNDTLDGGDGSDTLNGGDGDDSILGGTSDDDLRDIIYAGAGHDNIDAGAGNDLVYGQSGNDTIAGGFGVDELQGQEGDDVITGSAYSDLVFGGDGNDFVNGGFGHDRINGGSGADKFYHLGIFDHGSDWVQDYNAAEGDVLVFGQAGATADQFQINLAHTANAEGERSGDDDVQEAFVIYKPTGQIIWALVDGEGQSEINLQIGKEVFDLLA